MEYVSKTTREGKVVKLKNYKRRARINKLKRKLLLLFFLLIILFLILLFAPFMQIKTINCTGNNKISAEEIITASNINVGDNIIRINKKKAIDCIDDIPYIKSVDIDRKYPSAINIKVVECQVHAYVPLNDKFLYLDEDGKILEAADVQPNITVPVITGVNVTGSTVNEVIGFDNQAQLESYKAIVQTLANSRFKGMVTSIDVADTNKTVFTVNDTLDVILGDIQNLDYKINLLATEVYNTPENTKSGTLDLRFGNAILKQK